MRAAAAAAALTALAGTLTDPELRSNEFVNNLGPTLDQIQMQVNRAAFLDSLRHSTAADAALYEQFWKNVNHGAMPYGITKPIGKSAPPITADFWLNHSDSIVSRPTRGKVSLVVLINQKAFFGSDLEEVSWARLRRLAQRFPALEITFMAQTIGWFDKAAPPPPSEEAGLLAHALFAERHLGGALAVTNSAFWRLPSPDRRRINPQMPGLIDYSFGRTFQPPLVVDARINTFLVDQNGLVVDAAPWVDEAMLDDFIAILLGRPLATRP